MKKLLFLYIGLALFCSCQIIKQIDLAFKINRMTKKTEENYNYGIKKSFIIDKNFIFIPCRINNTTHFLFYDTKIGGLLHESIPYNEEFPQCKKTVKIKTKNSLKLSDYFKVGLKYYDLESDFFYFKNFVGIVTSQSNDSVTQKCISENYPYRFAIGREAFPNKDVTMLLSFSDTTITLFESNYKYDTTGFSLVKSLYTCRGIAVCLLIDSIEYAFRFDTGYKEFLSLPQYEKHKKENEISVIDTLFIQQTNNITISNLISQTGNIHYSQKITQPVLGMKFISHFDWIIDLNKGKIYAKPVKEFYITY